MSTASPRQSFIGFPGLREFAVKIASKFYDEDSPGSLVMISQIAVHQSSGGGGGGEGWFTTT